MKYEVNGPERYDHQKRGLQKLIRTGGVTALLFDPGMGKTATTLDYAGLLALKSPTREARVLVVCPLVAVDTWVMQCERWLSLQVNFWAEALGGSVLEKAEALASRGGEPYPQRLVKNPPKRKKAHHPRAMHADKSIALATRTDERERPITPSEGPDGVGDEKPRLVLEVININALEQRRRVGSRNMADVMVDAIKRFNPDMVVVDESHKIKSAEANASRLLARVAKFVKRRVILTGTVMPAGPLDVFGQWRFLEPTAFGTLNSDGSRRTATFGSFRAHYAVLGGWMGKEVVSYRNLDEMQRIMGRNAIVARKKDALDLPPTQDVQLDVMLSPAESKAYAQMKAELAVELTGPGGEVGHDFASATSRLTQMLRLRQITSGHLPDDEGSTRELGDSKARTIASLIHDTLTSEKRIVVFALFSHEIRMLTAAIERAGTEVMVITGGTSSEERMRMRKRFGSDDPARIVMIAQIKTMSVAVNELVTANHAIFGSLSQQRDDYIQARDRLDRIGQTRSVTFWHAVAPGTVDEVILKSHRDRTNLEEAVLEHIRGK